MGTDEARTKNSGRMEQVLLTSISALLLAYTAGDTLLNVPMPDFLPGLLLTLFVVFFLNRVWMKFEHYADNFILIMNMRAQQDKFKDEVTIQYARDIAAKSLAAWNASGTEPPHTITHLMT